MNMSHCRFRNTLTDLGDCYDHMSDGDTYPDPISEEERKARARLVELCEDIVSDYSAEYGRDLDVV